MCEEQTSFDCSLWICYSVFWVVGACNSPNQPNAVKRKKLAVDSVFNKFDDEDSDDVPRKRKLVPLDYGDEDKSSIKGSVNTEEKRKHIKSLIEKIPTAKPELFAYPLDWSIVDSVSWFLSSIHKKSIIFLNKPWNWIEIQCFWDPSRLEQQHQMESNLYTVFLVRI